MKGDAPMPSQRSAETRNLPRSILLLTILLVPGHALCADWRAVLVADGMAVFVDRESIHADSVHQDQDQLKAWVLKDYSGTRYIGDDFFPHRSALMLYVVACNEQKLGYTQWSLQSGNLGSGRTVWADHISDVSYLDAGADDEHRDVFQMVCSTWKLRASASDDAGTR